MDEQLHSFEDVSAVAVVARSGNKRNIWLWLIFHVPFHIVCSSNA